MLQEDYKSTFKYRVLGFVYLVLVFAAIISIVYYFQVVGTPINTDPVVHRDPTENWKTYPNVKYGFELKYPTDWKFSTDQVFGQADRYVFETTGSSLIVLPRGEFDFGGPWQEPQVSQIEFAGRSAQLEEWTLSDGSNFKRYKIKDKPADWNDANRIDITAKPEHRNVTNQMISSFKFTDQPMCIQVIQKAKNKTTGEVREFPTPCDVPEGWEKI
jgi:hypothetical protein